MKARTIILVFIIISFTAKSQDWIEFNPSGTTAPTYNLLSSTDSVVEFGVIVPGMFETSIDSFNRINIKEHSRLDSVGFPEIPVVSFLVAIPDCDSVNLIINPLDSSQFNGFNIYPSPDMLIKSKEYNYTAKVLLTG